MHSNSWNPRLGWIWLAAVILFFSPGPRQIIAVADENNAGQNPFGSQWFQNPLEPDGGKYWLGVECRDAQPELKSQLGLKEDEGLVVVHLADDGPAAKAGLKRHDVIIAAGDDKMKHVPDLVKAVNAADGKEVSLKILRAGKEQTISVTPLERPKENSQFIARPGPGFVFPGGGPPPELPDDVSVSIVRHGKEPPKITVTRGDEKWEISDKQLDKLPEELRPAVQRMLAAGSMPFPPMPDGFNMPGIRIEGMRFGGPPGSYPRNGNPPPRGGDNIYPPHDGQGPPPPAGPNPPRVPDFSGGFPSPMQPGQIPPELMERLDRLDRQLNMLQDELRRMQDGGPGSTPRMRPRGPGNGPDGPPPRDDQRDGPPPGDRDHRGPPPNDR